MKAVTNQDQVSIVSYRVRTEKDTYLNLKVYKLGNISDLILGVSCCILGKLYWLSAFLHLRLLKASVHCSNN